MPIGLWLFALPLHNSLFLLAQQVSFPDCIVYESGARGGRSFSVRCARDLNFLSSNAGISLMCSGNWKASVSTRGFAVEYEDR
ncbi:hypothetical protein XH99_06995 [Bradyrhizobium nanningense]|uniref:Secreted protein n=1 Tax=Bradyrhizobium nanningense TaxID=1325118 RepID=A0A4Q0SD71_9BRAD|nr:hypothetical protein XH99_06995 [Bradyrhizobium nanningense]